ncbi:hypothetical protein LP419_25795 [Massilia sp. H-1]|nr:hypothetical protein LP419_25795 [Massilia sp. H-1]
MLTRLQISLPSALWDLDKSKVDSIVEAEMLPPEVVSIRVYDTSVGLFSLSKLRASTGQLVAVDQAPEPLAHPGRSDPRVPGWRLGQRLDQAGLGRQSGHQFLARPDRRRPRVRTDAQSGRSAAARYFPGAGAVAVAAHGVRAAQAIA